MLKLLCDAIEAQMKAEVETPVEVGDAASASGGDAIEAQMEAEVETPVEVGDAAAGGAATSTDSKEGSGDEDDAEDQDDDGNVEDNESKLDAVTGVIVAALSMPPQSDPAGTAKIDVPVEGRALIDGAMVRFMGVLCSRLPIVKASTMLRKHGLLAGKVWTSAGEMDPLLNAAGRKRGRETGTLEE